MKPKTNKTWLIISLCIIINIFIFKFMSHKLESYVTNAVADTSTINESM